MEKVNIINVTEEEYEILKSLEYDDEDSWEVSNEL